MTVEDPRDPELLGPVSRPCPARPCRLAGRAATTAARADLEEETSKDCETARRGVEVEEIDAGLTLLQHAIDGHGGWVHAGQ